MRAKMALVAAVLFICTAAEAQDVQGHGSYGAPQNLTHPYQPSPPAKPLKTQALKDVSNPSDTLGSASVEDSKGSSVGQVQTVNTTKNGQVASVDVLLKTPGANNKVVSLKPSQLRYVPSGNLLRATMTVAKIDTLPAIKPKTLQDQQH